MSIYDNAIVILICILHAPPRQCIDQVQIPQGLRKVPGPSQSKPCGYSDDLPVRGTATRYLKHDRCAARLVVAANVAVFTRRDYLDDTRQTAQ